MFHCRLHKKGGGFIGLELAENLKEPGMDVTYCPASEAADELL